MFRAQLRLAAFLALLSMLGLVLAACGGRPRGRSSNSDDDDAADDDDDSAVGDDDDSVVADDDDAVGDDDDAVGDDDDFVDDDDAVQGGWAEPSTTFIDYGQIAVGTTTSQFFELDNTGGSTLTGQFQVTGTGFSLVGSDSFSLAPGGTTSRNINFSPTTTTTFSGSLQVFHDGDNASPVSVTLTGAGFQVAPEAGNCNDGVDNDNDGFFDCDDADCFSDPACQNTETSCTNGIDDDGDFLIDCNDPDCANDPACSGPGTETSCTNGIDDDGDFLVDCNDPDCANDPACQAGPDPCCATSGTNSTWQSCTDATAVACLCNLDGWCCSSGWDSTCQSEYVTDCGATTCGP